MCESADLMDRRLSKNLEAGVIKYSSVFSALCASPLVVFSSVEIQGAFS